MTLNKNSVNELKRLEYVLKLKYNQHHQFKKLYESINNKQEDREILRDIVLIKYLEVENMINNLTDELIEYLQRKDKTLKNLLTGSIKEIHVNSLQDLIQTIHYLIDILEFHLENTGYI